MIVETRYRDISAEDYLRCIKRRYHQRFARHVWEKLRGSRIRIETPPISLRGDKREFSPKCSGPYYRMVGVQGVVCIHHAEIGD